MESPARGPAGSILTKRAAERFLDGAPFLPAAAILAIWLALVPADGGYFARDWAPAGLVFIGLWAVTVVTTGRLMPEGRAPRAALGTLLALVAFAFLSITWTASPGTAWATANQFLVVVVAAWTLSLLPWTPGRAQLLMGLFAAGAAVALASELFTATAADDLSRFFVEARWAAPLGYPNGLGNFGFFAALPLLAISAAPDRGIAVKAGALGIATFLAGCSLLPQSRGSLLGLIVALPVLVALSPMRWRVVARIAVVGAAIAGASGAIFGVFDALTDDKTFVSGPLADARDAILLAALAATAAGLALALVESRVRVGERGERVARRAGFAAVAVVAAGLVVAAGVNADRIERVAEKQKTAWEKPRERYVDHGQNEGSRLLDPDPLQRYEYWHICLDALADAPLGGLGAGGFGARYTQVRAYTKHALFPHSLFMRAAGEAGIVGILGVLAFIAAVTAGLLAGFRSQSPGVRTVVAGAGAAGVLFTVHAQLDWLEEFPVLGGTVLAFLLVAMVVREREQAPPATPPRPPRLLFVAVAFATVVAAATVAVPYMALRYQERASAVWRADPARAYEDLDRAASLDPLSDVPKLSEGTIALQRREYDRARAAFEAALEREEGWLAHFEIALIDAAEGDTRAALRQLDVALRLNPLEAAIPAVRKEIGAGKAIDPVRLNKRLFESPLFNSGRLT